MKYFALIDGERRGPYTLEELPGAGVMPDTLLWCKGMADWKPADEIGDVCRFYRLRIASLMNPEPEPELPRQPQTVKQELPFGNEPDTSLPPPNLVPICIIATLLCFWPLGLVSIYMAAKSRSEWKKGNGRSSYEYLRLAKMMLGLCIFLGVIMIAFIGKKLGAF